MQHHCVTWLTFDPGALCCCLTKTTCTFCLPHAKLRRHALLIISFGAETSFDPITYLPMLHLRRYRRKLRVRYRWLVRPCRTGFPPAKCCTLLGALCVKIQVFALYRQIFGCFHGVFPPGFIFLQRPLASADGGHAFQVAVVDGVLQRGRDLLFSSQKIRAGQVRAGDGVVRDKGTVAV